MRTISNLLAFSLTLGLAHAASPLESSPVCRLSGFEKVSNGWINKYSRGDQIWVFKTSPKLLDSSSGLNASVASLARLSALKQFNARFKKVNPPSDENVQWVIHGMQMKTDNCSGEPWVQYSVEVQNMSWESTPTPTTPTTSSGSAKPSSALVEQVPVNIVD